MQKNTKTHPPLRWGIVGLGNIAHQFMEDLRLVEKAQAVAVASRTVKKAAEFAGRYGVKKYYANYHKLFEDPEVDIVYIATPHDSHAGLSIAAMDAGKHVLCEKPLAVNRQQVESMVEAARQNNVFLMEALWSKFNPTIRECLHLVENGAIGSVNYVNADFTFYRQDKDSSRMLNMQLAGGSLLDMGVYPVFLAYTIFGKPEQILATARFHSTGADIQTSAILKFQNGIANVMSGFASQSDMKAKIYGTKGSIIIDPYWHEAQGYTLIMNEGKAERQVLPTKGKGFTYEIEECIRCIEQNQIESKAWSHQHSLGLIKILDEIRRQSGLRYPFE